MSPAELWPDPADVPRGTRSLRELRTRRAADVPGTPAGVLLSRAWDLVGTGRIGAGVVPARHPDGGTHGRLVLWGAGIWPAVVEAPTGVTSTARGALRRAGRGASADAASSASLAAGEASILEAADRFRPGGVDEPVVFRVEGPDGPIGGLIDQPWVRSGEPGRLIRRMSRRHSRLRIRAAERTWTFTATSVPGMVRVVRVDATSIVVLAPRGVRASSVAPDADRLDLTVALLTLSAVQESAYDPVFGAS
jgi:hypothetical protein